jgi:hypothetical protein
MFVVPSVEFVNSLKINELEICYHAFERCIVGV